MPEVLRSEEGRDFKVGQPAFFTLHSTDRENGKGNWITSMALPQKPETGRIISEKGSGDKYKIVGVTSNDKLPGDTIVYQLELERVK